ncbi:phospholipase D/nuclease [Rozella allomycis CSF55]|uniref:phospholipase D n=1 Tax=Rozella allomycis (strain CSF55) TaxID=988480 RepID=A0A4P9YMF9_ROZAC|nr:phospholipase D/nuclease [Rozella allomycis CSF55]
MQSQFPKWLMHKYIQLDNAASDFEIIPKATTDSEDDDFFHSQRVRQFTKDIKRKLVKVFSRKNPRELEILVELDTPTKAMYGGLVAPFYRFTSRDSAVPVPVMFSMLDVHIVCCEHDNAMFDANLPVTIHLTYGVTNQKWKVSHSLLDFAKLHSILRIRHLKGHIPRPPSFPPQLVHLVNQAKDWLSDSKQRMLNKVLMTRERITALEIYLKQLLAVMNMKSCIELCEFLEISGCLVKGPIQKFKKEGYLKQKVHSWGEFFTFVMKCWIGKRYEQRWIVVGDSFVAVLERIDSQYPIQVLLYDSYFRISEETKLFHPKLVVANYSQKLELLIKNDGKRKEWFSILKKQSFVNEFCKVHPHGSFAPVRLNCHVEWFIDGQDTFKSIYEAINNAQRQIFIHGWWVSPELYLLRPSHLYPESRLDKLLKLKASQGVQIFIIVYKEVSFALPINSYHTKFTLQGLHKNIKVQRYPDRGTGPLYWAHHDKLVIIDQSIAFTGGLDLCYGRYDDQSHSIVDISDTPTWPGLDYYNPRVKDFRNVHLPDTTLVDRKLVPRMAWHDVHCVIQGEAANDLSRHFIQRWNFIKTVKAMSKGDSIPFLFPGSLKPFNKTVTGKVNIQCLRSCGEWSMGTIPEKSIYDAYIHHIRHSRRFIYIENQFFVSTCAKPSPVRNEIALEIANRIKLAFERNETFKVIIVIPLMPAFEAEVNQSAATTVRRVMKAQLESISRGPNSLFEKLKSWNINPENFIAFLSLRRVDDLLGNRVTQQIYVHSKLCLFCLDQKWALKNTREISKSKKWQ